jgi:hypothetical protein
LNILTQTRIGAEGIEMRSWIVPEEIRLTPGPDWIEQEPPPPGSLVATLAGSDSLPMVAGPGSGS